MKDLNDIIGETSPEERKRLQRVHDLLLEAGPPPELPPALAQAPVPTEPPRQRDEYRWLPQRRAGRMLTLAVGLAVVALAIGYAIGRHGTSFQASFTEAMHGTKFAPSATGVLDVGKLDAAGNWPLQLKTTGLRTLPKGGYYELWLTKAGRRKASCGTFRVQPGQTTVRLNAPYDFRQYRGWIVVRRLPGQAESPKPLLST
jgi:hypothetical protein